MRIPEPSHPFEGRLARLYQDATPRPLKLDKRSEGRPNVLLVMLDDVGFGTCSTFGGPIPLPESMRWPRRGSATTSFIPPPSALQRERRC